MIILRYASTDIIVLNPYFLRIFTKTIDYNRETTEPKVTRMHLEISAIQTMRVQNWHYAKFRMRVFELLSKLLYSYQGNKSRTDNPATKLNYLERWLK